ncbi:hypothetical protein K457DRAFT_132457 [Linnemannia elongata AG-77]|uniref:Uncharacterized protein n=1 Tax=Linnemannia elongata AG-77 TaxID=1314771 RepID=A0A197KDI4_9FUNG|nr:hypothetical protein K457DRAFT_132457 [Linnemannia elongata AG-77]
MVAAATKLPSLKTSITQANSSTFAASPVEWWFPPADNTTPPFTTRIGDLFLLAANENNKYRQTEAGAGQPGLSTRPVKNQKYVTSLSHRDTGPAGGTGR